MKGFFIRSIPLLVAFFAGAAVFITATFFMEHGSWYDILIEISGALIGIPFVFLIYNYTEYKILEKINKTIFDNLSFEINAVVLEALRETKNVLSIKQDINWDIIQKMIDMNAKEIKKVLKINKNTVAIFQDCNEQLNNIVYNRGNITVLEHEILQNILLMGKELSVIANEINYGKRKDEIAAHIQKLLNRIDDWFEISSEKALKKHEHFQFNVDTTKN